MKPFETLATVLTPEGLRLALHRREDDYFIYLDGEELMSSRAYGSEEALAELACRDLPGPEPYRVLIGGLGLGYTLRASLAVLPSTAEVIVAELFPAVVAWNQKYLDHLGRPLDDPRVRVCEQDVRDLLGEEHRGAYHAILLDVDNGPSAWCLESNTALYRRQGLARIERSLVRSGVLAVWSAYEDPGFVQTLRKSGFTAECRRVRARGRKGAQQFVFLARSPLPDD